MNMFARFDDGQWGAKIVTPEAQPGAKIDIYTHKGKKRSVTLGELVKEDGATRYFRIVPKAAVPVA